MPRPSVRTSTSRVSRHTGKCQLEAALTFPQMHKHGCPHPRDGSFLRLPREDELVQALETHAVAGVILAVQGGHGMDRSRLTDTSIFQFALGQRVTWGQPHPQVWLIHVRMLLDDAQGPAVQYGIRPESRPVLRHEFWVWEAELEPSPRTPQEGA